MKILIITHYFPPMTSIASLRPYSWAKYWSRSGHDVTVLTTSTDNETLFLQNSLKKLRVVKCSNNLLCKRSQFKSNLSKKTSMHKKSQNSVFKNFLNNISYKTGCFLWDCRCPTICSFWEKDAVSKIKKIGENYDLAFATFTPYSTFKIGCKLKKSGIIKKLVLDFRDLWVDSHMFKGVFPFNVYEKILEKKCIAESNIVTTVSTPLANVLRHKYPHSNIHVIENGFDREDIENIGSIPYWNDGKIRIIYTGSVYEGKRDPSPLLAAISDLKKTENKRILLQNLEVIFVGAISGNVDSLIEKYGVKNWVKHKGFLPRKEVLRMQRDAHALLFLEFEAPGIDGILTGKLFEYLASGTEIWGIGVTENSSPGRLIKRANAGILFGKNSSLIKEQLRKMLLSGDKIKKDVNREILNMYDREVLANKMLDIVSQYR